MMKKLIWVIFILILRFCLIVWAKGNPLREIRTEIKIDAFHKKYGASSLILIPGRSGVLARGERFSWVWAQYYNAWR